MLQPRRLGRGVGARQILPVCLVLDGTALRHVHSTLHAGAAEMSYGFREGSNRYLALCKRNVAEQRRRILQREKRRESTASARDLLETFEYALSVAIELAAREKCDRERARPGAVRPQAEAREAPM